ncbi:MAG TPA: S8 family serine peptidase, partial [Thermoanaerobaculia bacterium]
AGGAAPPAGGATPPPAGGAGTPAAGGAGTGTAGGAGSAGSATGRAAARAADWARAIVASRAALGVNLTTLNEVPAALRDLAGDLAGLKEILHHFFTYSADGAYYRRWAGAGRDPSNPAHLTPEYKQNNVLEVQLERERTYLYAVVPESLLTGGGDLGQGVFREIVVRFDETAETAEAAAADRPFSLATVHTARWRRASAPHEDFVFFYTQEGVGLPAAREVRDKMAPRLQSFLSGYFAAGEVHRDDYLRASKIVSFEGGTTLVHLLAMIDGAPALPAGVIPSGDAPSLNLLAPPERVIDIAALPAIKKLTTVPVAQPSLDLARPAVHYPALDSRIAAGSRGGKGVLVGIIDSGVDGSHQAFAGRLVAVWDQGTPPAVAGQNPHLRHPADHDYDGFNWGTELMGTTETATSLDPSGHGTHVTGIAAGAEVRDAAGNVLCPAGLAPQAKIVVVRCIGVAGGDPSQALRYIFKKAQELALPCVVNMSFGHQDHGHEGSDDLSFDLFNQSRSGGSYRPGRILVGAADNQRGSKTHVSRSVAAGSAATPSFLSIPIQLGAQAPNSMPYTTEVVAVWVKNPTGVCPLAFPLDLMVYRLTNPYANTAVVRLGSSTSPAGWFPGLKIRIDVFSQLYEPRSGDFSFHVQFTYAAPGNVTFPADTWVIALSNRTAHPLEVHAWIPAGWRGASQFVGATQADDDAFLVGAPTDSPAVVSVASVDSRLTWRPAGGAADLSVAGTLGEISGFSSPGPLRSSSVTPNSFYNVTDVIRAVDVTGPGQRIQSALSAQSTPDPNDVMTKNAAGTGISVLDQGTSMASPLIAGMVANLLAVKPNLTVLDVLDRLKRASAIPAASHFQPPAGTPAGQKPWSRDWGFGLVDGATLDIT